MRTDILANTDERSEELRYVTTHFKDLQGLRIAGMWAAFLILSTTEPSIHRLPLWQRAAAGLAFVLFGFAWLVWSNRWYKQRYGLVQNPEPAVSSGIISIFHPEPQPQRARNHNGFPALYLLFVGMYIVPGLFARFDSRSGSIFGIQAVIFFVLPRCLYRTSGLVLVRLRRALCMSGAVVICGIYGSYLFTDIGAGAYLAIVCAVLLLLDLYDHWLFTRLLHGGPEHSYE